MDYMGQERQSTAFNICAENLIVIHIYGFKEGACVAQVRQISNALDVLEFYAQVGRPAGLNELSEHFGWPRSSTFNVIDTLVERGFLYEPRTRAGFYPTPRWLSLSQEISTAEPLPDEVFELVRTVSEQMGETTWVAAPSGQNAIMLSVANSPQPIRYVAEPGKRVPIHATATGHALMSLMSPQQRESLLKRAMFVKYGSGTPLNAAEVENRITEGVERGWFVSASNFSPDLGGISMALPVFGRHLAFTVAGPMFRFEGNALRIAEAMRVAIDKIIPK